MGIGEGRDSQRVWTGHVHTAIFRMDNQQGPTVQHMELCSMLCGSLDGRGVWKRMDTCTCMAESLHCSPATITPLLIGFTTTTTTTKLLQSCPTLCDPTDGSPPGSAVPEILQARTLEWVAISFSNA